MKNKTNLPLLLLCLSFFVTSLLLLAPLKTDMEIYDKTIRLHVLANSDSEEDQDRKLKVRDAVLSYVSTLVDSCEDVENASCVLSSSLDRIRLLSEQVLSRYGSDDKVSVTLDKERYPTREYENVRLPAGTYTSLRVQIGEAEGKNWWCVLFPPLCTKTAEQNKELLAVGLTQNQVRVLTDDENGRYVLRFKILELLGSLMGKGSK